MEALDLPEIKNKPINSLFSKCYYCQKNNRIWYSSFDDFYEAAMNCGIDYIEVRIDQMLVQKKAVVLVMVYCSINKSSLVVDSVVYIQRNSTSTIKNVVTGLIDENIKELKIDLLNSSNLLTKGKDYTRNLAERTKDFCATGQYSEITRQFKYCFSINGTAYIVANDRFLSKKDTNALLLNNNVPCSSIRRYYRIGNFNDSVNCFSVRQFKQAQAQTKASLRDHYVFNECIIEYDISSEIGISALKFHSENLIDREMQFSGEKKINGSISIGFGKKSSILSVQVIDADGNTLNKNMRIFPKTDSEQNKRDHENAILEARNAWAKKNSLNSTINFISKFEGNIVSGLLAIYCEGQAQENLLRIPDVFSFDSVTQFTLPLSGRAPYKVPNSKDCEAVYICNSALSAKSKQISGTKIAVLHSPSLTLFSDSININTNLELPIGKGYYLPKWKCENASVSTPKCKALVLICGSASTMNGALELNDFPVILESPFKRMEYCLVINSVGMTKDSLILTYLVKYLDRTQDLYYRTIEMKSDGTNRVHFENLNGNDAVIKSKTERIWHENEQIIVSKENIESKKKMLGIYIFVYSQKLNATIGASGLWTQY
jgi:hypothetical protein